MLTVSSSGLTKIVATRRLKEFVSTVGCMVGDAHHLPTSRPRGNIGSQKEQDKGLHFQGVWRERLAATIQLAATPEARSLTCL